MQTLRVELGERSYSIHIGAGLLRRSDLVAAMVPGQQVMVVTNATVAPLYLPRVMRTLRAFQCENVVLPDGEQYKTLESVQRIYDVLLQNRFGRSSTLIALGGGVVGDVTGFAAATYQRGVHFVQIPTTLLAQVDSSVGGKTGVNHPLGKNMIGAFYQPRGVIADIDTLHTLDPRQMRAGLAEVIKYGLIRDAEFFAWLEAHVDQLLRRQPEVLATAIERSCRNKAEVVAADELESGQRALLNFGHTFGHAIETGSGYGSWLHGEAVAAGMVMGSDLSVRMGWLAEKDRDRIERLLRIAGLPVQGPPGLSAARFLDLMSIDKKVLAGRLRLVLLRGIGRAVVTQDFSREHLTRTLEACRAAA